MTSTAHPATPLTGSPEAARSGAEADVVIMLFTLGGGRGRHHAVDRPVALWFSAVTGAGMRAGATDDDMLSMAFT
jgi:hypothetical protein